MGIQRKVFLVRGAAGEMTNYAAFWEVKKNCQLNCKDRLEQ